MAITLYQLCDELNNWDFNRRAVKVYDEYTISDGSIDLSDLVNDGTIQTGQYFRIVGSVFNDGLYTYPATGLTDETFEGSVWAMAVPAEVIALMQEINAWLTANESAIAGAYASESFKEYSYTLKNGMSGAEYGDADTAWKAQFATSLNKWRKLR